MEKKNPDCDVCLRKCFAIYKDTNKTARITSLIKKRRKDCKAMGVHTSERGESQSISKANLGEAPVLRKGSQQKFQ